MSFFNGTAVEIFCWPNHEVSILNLMQKRVIVSSHWLRVQYKNHLRAHSTCTFTKASLVMKKLTASILIFHSTTVRTMTRTMTTTKKPLSIPLLGQQSQRLGLHSYQQQWKLILPQLFSHFFRHLVISAVTFGRKISKIAIYLYSGRTDNSKVSKLKSYPNSSISSRFNSTSFWSVSAGSDFSTSRYRSISLLAFSKKRVGWKCRLKCMVKVRGLKQSLMRGLKRWSRKYLLQCLSFYVWHWNFPRIQIFALETDNLPQRFPIL